MTGSRAGVVSIVLAVGVTSAVGCSSGGGGAKGAASAATSTSSSAPAGSPSSTQAQAAASTPSTCGPTTTVANNASRGPEVNPAGDIPDNQAFVPFSPAGGGYTVQVPEGWARADSPSSVTFTDKFNSIRVEIVPAAQAPTVDSARATELASLSTALRCFEPGPVSTVTRKAGSAVLVRYKADSPPDPVTGKVVHDDVERYELWRNGREAVITLAAAQGSDNVDPWRKVTDSFTWA